jgi:hypothetical protein
MIRAIAFKGGYVEGNTCSWMVYQVSDNFAFSTAKEALASLSHYLFHKFSLDYKHINIDDWNQFIWSLFGSDNDSYGYDSSEEAQQACGADWLYYVYGFDVPLNEMIVIHERAENIFLCSLNDNHKEFYAKFDEDDDFSDGPNDMDLEAYKELIEE